MNALLLGSEGFVGRHTYPALLARGYDVTGIDIKSGVDARKYLAKSTQRYDLIIHAAAIVGGRNTIDNAPLKVAYDFGLDSDVIQHAARTKPGRIVLISSSAAYPADLQQRGERHQLSEPLIDLHGDFMGTPDAIYGLTKLVLEAQGEKLREFGVPVTIIRPFSGYGEDQDTDYPFRSFLDRARAKADPFDIWGDGTAVRDWLSIDDFVEMMLTLVDEGIDGPVNLSTGIPTTFLELAKLFTDAAGYSPEFRFHTNAPQGVHYRVGHPGKINRIRPAQITIEQGVKRALSNE